MIGRIKSFFEADAPTVISLAAIIAFCAVVALLAACGMGA